MKEEGRGGEGRKGQEGEKGRVGTRVGVGEGRGQGRPPKLKRPPELFSGRRRCGKRILDFLLVLIELEHKTRT